MTHSRLDVAAHNAKQFLIVVDQGINAAVGLVLALLWLLRLFPWDVGLWWADETLSAHAYRLSLDGVRLPMRAIDALLFWDKGHCEASYRSELLRLQSPPSARAHPR